MMAGEVGARCKVQITMRAAIEVKKIPLCLAHGGRPTRPCLSDTLSVGLSHYTLSSLRDVIAIPKQEASAASG